MLSKELQEALNQQINNEIYPAYLEAMNLRGFAHWMRMQHDEEMSHGMRRRNL